MDRSLTKEIGYLNHMIRKYMSGDHEPHKEFNFTQFQVIGYLFRHQDEDICQKDLEAETGLKKASMTGCLDALEKKGAIIRETAKDDRRRNYIRMTDRMRKVEKDFRERNSRLDSLITKNICESDLEVFLKVMDQIRENIREAEHETDI